MQRIIPPAPPRTGQLVASVAAHRAYYGLIERYEANLLAPLTLMTPLATIGMGVLITGDAFDMRMAIAGVLVVALRPGAVAPLALARQRG